jgi:hypothetical protein
VESEVAEGDLQELRIRQMRVVRKLYLVYRRDRPLTAAAQALVAVIRAKRSRHPIARRERHRVAKPHRSQLAGESL